MARKVYFSFHYQDVADFRANVVRNSGTFGRRSIHFHDASIWEEAPEKKVATIKKLIDDSLIGLSVTCVLIGSETYTRRWVRYEIIKSFVEKKGLLGVGINWIKGKNKKTKFWPGKNPFEYLKLQISTDGDTIRFYEYKDGWVKYKDLPQTENLHFSKKMAGQQYEFSELFKKYSYVWHDGRNDFQTWIENAAKNVGR